MTDHRPKMILFDYGHTLLYEPGFDFLLGEKKLAEHIRSNKYGVTSEQVTAFAAKIFTEIGEARQLGLEINERQFQRFIYEYLGIEFSISLEAAEIIQWDAVSMGERMPDAEKIIKYVNRNGIRSGVISNIGWSGNALTERINRLLPSNQFEFILASSEYMFRKPHRYIFELALHKAGLEPGDVWFCGDNVKADVEGAANAGMFPVWYDDLTVENPRHREQQGIIPNCRHLHIHHWDELIDVLEELES
ncbi:MAG: HAD family hydrolase [Saccharofermentanales bacterium]